MTVPEAVELIHWCEVERPYIGKPFMPEIYGAKVEIYDYKLFSGGGGNTALDGCGVAEARGEA
jgi:hypothetical protein